MGILPCVVKSFYTTLSLYFSRAANGFPVPIEAAGSFLPLTMFCDRVGKDYTPFFLC